MRIDSKKRRVQQKYKEIIELKKQERKHTIEVLIAIFLIVFLSFLNGENANVFNFNSSAVEVGHPENKWIEVVSKMDEKLKVNYAQYTGIAIDFNPKPIKYILKTSIQDSDLDNDQHLGELIKDANAIIESSKLPNLLQEDETYEIIVRGIDNDELARKGF
ncbi:MULTISPECIES: hypothetical protein [Cytobacillus]|uniref:hypothetical protein n=1 Tax=Cytobacillus TaxID=2675230 RepID=UPI00203E95F0|nr:hypothetical protein [Cytobacillus kochii]MCM3325085.1 hypothetical protein [Cytobacillus kochii]MCM3345995.1 hypothetical protein [Cytobacillus kochii]